MSKPCSRRSFIGLSAAALAGSFSSCNLSGKSSKKLRLAFFTDVHCRVEWNTPAALQRAADAINAQSPEIVVAGGDLITEGFQSGTKAMIPRWETYLNFHTSIQAPVFPVIGNHDFVGAMPEDGSAPEPNPRKVFCEKFNLENTFRSFDYKGIHFILLDSFKLLGEKDKFEGYIDEVQREWIKSDLARLPPGRGIVLVLHMPLLTAYFQALYGAEKPPRQRRVIKNNVEVLNLFGKHNLIAVLQGHLHVNEQIVWRNTRFITGGAVCGKWWRGPRKGTEEGFGMLTIDGQSSHWEYIDYGWEAQRPTGV